MHILQDFIRQAMSAFAECIGGRGSGPARFFFLPAGCTCQNHLKTNHDEPNEETCVFRCSNSRTCSEPPKFYGCSRVANFGDQLQFRDPTKFMILNRSTWSPKLDPTTLQMEGASTRSPTTRDFSVNESPIGVLTTRYECPEYFFQRTLARKNSKKHNVLV
jgi:hypothetical protein